MKKEELIEFFTAHNFTTETESMRDDFKTWEVVRIINSEGGLAGYFLFIFCAAAKINLKN